jgi:hypothetical protein
MKKKHRPYRYLFFCAAAFAVVFLPEERENGAYIPPSRSFAVVECPVSVSDRDVADQLEERGIQGVICESTQFFLMSAWNGLEQVPLDALDKRLIDADPRRDVYAQKLREFFVNDKARRFFVPLANWKNKSIMVVEAEIRDALSGMPVSSIIIQSVRSPLSRVFARVEKAAVLAVVLMICGFFILPVFRDFLSGLAYRGRKSRQGNMPFRSLMVSVFLTAVLAASGAAVSGFWSGGDGVRLIFLVLPLVFFLVGGMAPVWLQWAAMRRHGHTLFRPVALRGIRPRSERRFPPVIFVVLLAVAALACAASFFAGAGNSGTGFSNDGYGGIVSEEEYRAHGRRQTLFAYLPLGIDRAELAPSYLRYAEGADGLYVAAGTVDEAEVVMPPYPLDGLAAFVEGTAGAAREVYAPPPDGVLLFVIALSALIPFAILGRRHEDL